MIHPQPIETPPSTSGPEQDTSPSEPSTNAPDQPKRRSRSLVRDLIETVILVVVIYVGIRTFVAPFEVQGASMTPYLQDGERLFVNRTAYVHFDTNALWNLLPWEERTEDHEVYPFSEPERGDIIVLRPPVPAEEPYIKRIIALPGETVTFGDGSVSIDGEPLTEPYLNGAVTSCEDGRWCSLTVPPEHVYVLGDNREHSADSRSFGPVPYDQIVGQAIFSNWPLDTLGPIDHPDYGIDLPDELQ